MILDQKFTQTDFKIGLKYYLAISPPEGRLFAAPFLSRVLRERLNLTVGDYVASAIANNWVVFSCVKHQNGELHVWVRMQEQAIQPYKVYLAVQQLLNKLYGWFYCRTRFSFVAANGSITSDSANSLAFARLILYHYYNKF